MDTDPNNLTSKEINPLTSIDKCEDELWPNHLAPQTIPAGKETEEYLIDGKSCRDTLREFNTTNHEYYPGDLVVAKSEKITNAYRSICGFNINRSLLMKK